MRSFNLQRGSTNWPFVIVLLALLAFVYMWWQAQDGKDQDKKEIDDLKGTVAQLRKAANDTRKELDSVAKVVGYPKRLDAIPSIGVDAAVSVNLPILQANLTPDGVVPQGDGSTDGFMKVMTDNGFAVFEATKRTGDGAGEAKTYELQLASEELKAALEDLAGMEVPAMPVATHDPDDEEAQAAYEEAVREAEAALEEWRQKIAAATGEGGFEEYKRVITTYGIVDPDEMSLVKVMFLSRPTTETVEGVFNAVKSFPAAMRTEFEAANKADKSVITRLGEDLKAKETELGEKEKELTTANDTYATDIASKDANIQSLQEELQQARVAAQTLQSQLAQEKDDRRADVARLASDKEALQEGLRLTKQKQDLKIRRDEPDGLIVASNPMLNTATIDLGFSDKVYVGQVFNVSALDRVGDRVAKGRVMVTKVTGRHSARVSIEEAYDTITSGDFIHNPLYSPTDTIYVYFAGPIAKWPKDMAKGRLAAMGVVLQDAINGDTDYIVVPNSWTVPVDAGGEDDEEEEEDVGAKSDLEKMEDKARIVGANVITERLFDSFLAY